MNMSDAENELFESKLLQSIFRRLCSMACLMSSAYFCHEFRCSPSWEYTMLTFLLVQGSIFFLIECSFFSWGEAQSDSTCHRQVMNIRWFCTSHRSELKPLKTSASLLQVSSERCLSRHFGTPRYPLYSLSFISREGNSFTIQIPSCLGSLFPHRSCVTTACSCVNGKQLQ